jgi:hypothetical protein
VGLKYEKTQVESSGGSVKQSLAMACVERIPPSNRGQDARDTTIAKAFGLDAATHRPICPYA